MDPTNPLRPTYLDDLANHSEPNLAYGTGPSYTPYHWEHQWIPTPEPLATPLRRPLPEPPRLPRYEDGLLTPEQFERAMRDLRR